MINQPNEVQVTLMPNPIVPRTVALELLWGCNLKCNYCYVGTEKNWQHPVVPKISSLFAIIDRIAAANVQEICLVGGEPMAHPKFEEICKYVASSAIPVYGLCTNGTMITPSIAKMLKSLDFYIDLSFRGAHAETFDSITGMRGSFKKVLEGVRMLTEVGFSIGVEFDCTPQTSPELYDLIRMLVEQKAQIHQIFLHRISPQGDAASRSDKTQMTLEDYNRVFEQVRQITEEFSITTTFEDGFPLCLTSETNWDYIVPCECGTFFATIDPQGNVRRCACHPNMLGNVLTTDLSTIWSSKLQTFRSLSWLNDACKSCALLPQCRGGCPVSSPNNPEGFAPDVFSDKFLPYRESSQHTQQIKGLLGQNIINIKQKI